MTELSAPRSRFAVLDIARGVAIIAMAIYHFCWDLAYFRFITADVGYGLEWVIFGRLVLTAFLMLVGIGLVLAHGQGIRWRSFWRREAMVAGAAILITVATWFAFPDSFVYFGVLHAIAVTSLLALPFVLTPLWLTVLVAALAVLLPAIYSNSFFDAPWTSWIGFWVKAPPTNDLVSVFPWLGIVLLGVIGARLVLASGVAEEEKRLRKIAQRGVVKLFNAVRAAQVKAEQAAKEERKKGTVGMANREEKVNEISKQGFLDLIGGKKSTKSSTSVA